jgi:cytosine/adenosine deaminase-related metal-dependent hydrolase
VTTTFDFLIEGGTVITMDEDNRVLHGDVLIRNGKIQTVAAWGKAKPKPGTRTVDARGCYVLPGFVQPHVHLCQALFRGLAEEVPLLEWLKSFIWPLEGAHNEASLRASANLGLAELLLGGTTTILDMGTVHHTGVLFEAARDAGIRYLGGKAMMDADEGHPESLTETTEQSLDAAVKLASQWHGAEKGRLKYVFEPRFILSCTPKLMKEAALAARDLGCLITTHAAENPEEVEAVRNATGKDNIEALHKLGLSGEDVILAHCVHLSDKERKLLKNGRTAVVHCPSTNLKLASGIAPIVELREAGVRVGIAADGAPCNNRLSAFSEMRLASLLQKPRRGADAFNAREALRAATLGGAEVLGMGDSLGSLEKGKRGDVVVVSAQGPHMHPHVDPIASIVYAAEAADVRHVFVDGQWLVRDGNLTRLILDEVLEDAEVELEGVLERSGVPAPHRAGH